ncbi:MAG: Cys-tRNA(Pro) deacylase [Desulforegulaceae bacterium]|nr:Cys-tRNA(Pro) deacylase [Desulforegulaceae bacterium]
MTPAINLLKKNKINFKILSFEHDKNNSSYGIEAVEKLNQNPLKIFKTLIVKDVSLKNNYFTAVIPAVKRLNLKLFSKEFNLKKAEISNPDEASRITGYIVGGISPVSQKKKLKTIIDSSALDFETIIVSAGKRGLEIEISVLDLSKITNAKLAEISE